MFSSLSSLPSIVAPSSTTGCYGDNSGCRGRFHLHLEAGAVSTGGTLSLKSDRDGCHESRDATALGFCGQLSSQDDRRSCHHHDTIATEFHLTHEARNLQEGQGEYEDPLASLWREDRRCYLALEWALEQVPHNGKEDIMQAVEIEDLLASFTTNGRTEQSGPDRRPTGGSFGREPSVAGQPESSPLFTPPLPPPTADFEHQGARDCLSFRVARQEQALEKPRRGHGSRVIVYNAAIGGNSTAG